METSTLGLEFVCPTSQLCFLLCQAFCEWYPKKICTCHYNWRPICKSDPEGVAKDAQMTSVSLTLVGLTLIGQGHTVKIYTDDMKREAIVESCSHKSRNAWGHQSQKEVKSDLTVLSEEALDF